MTRLLGWILILWCPFVIIVSLFLKSYLKPFLISGMALGGFVVGVVAILVGLKKKKADPVAFHLLTFVRKGFKNTPLAEFTGYEIIALGFLSFLSAMALFSLYFW